MLWMPRLTSNPAEVCNLKRSVSLSGQVGSSRQRPIYESRRERCVSEKQNRGYVKLAKTWEEKGLA